MNFNSYIVSETKTAFSVPFQSELPLIKKTFKQKAFTLAETLITLSIIGVVAAMTVPTLMSNSTKQQYVTGLKKAYNLLQQAAALQHATEPDTYQLKISEYLKIEPVKFENQEKVWVWTKTENIGQTADGMLFFDYDAREISNGTSTFGVDINGTKGPNKYGRDIFYFAYTNGKLLPEGSKLYETHYPWAKDIPEYQHWKTSNRCTTENVKKQVQPFPEQLGCTGRVLEEGAMNY